jgi:hypothetical protein
MEDESIKLVAEALPREWVLRPYRPDYGLDLAVETFREVDGSPGSYETMGEHFFVQVKSVPTVTKKRVDVRPRLNVAKFSLEQRPQELEPQAKPIEVIPFVIDTSLLNTVQAMGASVVVYLFLVSLDVPRVFFVCLNDYIDKILVPEQPTFSQQQTVTLHIPFSNEIARGDDFVESLSLLEFFAKRAQFYAAFNLFAYQRHELGYCDDAEAARRMATHFLKVISMLDIWECPTWRSIEKYYRWLSHLNMVLPNIPTVDWFSQHPFTEWNKELLEDEAMREMACSLNITDFWNGLNVLSRNYEEVCREWFLPTYFAEGLRRHGADEQVPGGLLSGGVALL